MAGTAAVLPAPLAEQATLTPCPQCGAALVRSGALTTTKQPILHCATSCNSGFVRNIQTDNLDPIYGF